MKTTINNPRKQTPMSRNRKAVLDLIVTNDESASSKRIFEIYDQISGIVERTNAARGKTRKFVVSSSSTGSDKLISNACSSTH